MQFGAQPPAGGHGYIPFEEGFAALPTASRYYRVNRPHVAGATAYKIYINDGAN
ncbi:hypothetical protein WI664_00210 [Vibrio cholerae]